MMTVGIAETRTRTTISTRTPGREPPTSRLAAAPRAATAASSRSTSVITIVFARSLGQVAEAERPLDPGPSARAAALRRRRPCFQDELLLGLVRHRAARPVAAEQGRTMTKARGRRAAPPPPPRKRPSTLVALSALALGGGVLLIAVAMLLRPAPPATTSV